MKVDDRTLIEGLQHAQAVHLMAICELMRLVHTSDRAATASALRLGVSEYMQRMAPNLKPDGDRMLTLTLQTLLESIDRGDLPTGDAKEED